MEWSRMGIITAWASVLFGPARKLDRHPVEGWLDAGRQLGPERFSVLFFPGGHQWAPATSFAQALDWIESRARYLKNLRLRFGEVTRSIRSWMPTRKSALYPKKA